MYGKFTCFLCGKTTGQINKEITTDSLCPDGNLHFWFREIDSKRKGGEKMAVIKRKPVAKKATKVAKKAKKK